MQFKLPKILLITLIGSSAAAPASSNGGLRDRQCRLGVYRDIYHEVFLDKATMEDSARYQAAVHSGGYKPGDTVIAACNRAGEDIHIWAESPCSGQNKIGGKNILVEPDQCLLLATFAYEEALGAMRAFEGCSDDGICSDVMENTATKFEWTAWPTGKPDEFVKNLSMVDGYNLGMEVSTPNGGTCSGEHHCRIPWTDVEKKCPTANLFRGGDHATCMSDCRALHKGCEVTDPPSNLWGKQFCPEGSSYWYNSDNRNNETCRTGGVILVEIFSDYSRE